ncbi:hypothetical protein SAMN05216223_116117 [Actinacidiphila yanglinensis]|uniref:Uncharacterized protein n=1 Tax=Actinacidiphila yanglinensis TaxID=310779 RepID=A0A1H6DJT7_9ACTN|nr:hypothetical protein [Actinacidiphila yanglinensis]SEG85677.1 hypothetical protein SAMN05216223_116117 [Actinacidiphila yanglinensis]
MNVTNTLAVGWIQSGTNLGTSFETLLIDIVVPIIATIGVLVVWAKTRSGPAALAAIILGAIVWWGVANMGVLATKTGDDINQSNNGSVSYSSGSGYVSGGSR